MAVTVDEPFLANLLNAHRSASWIREPEISKKLFQYLVAVAQQFRYAPPAVPNAIVFLVSLTRSTFPQAIFFQDNFYPVRSLNRLLFSAALTGGGVLMLLSVGLELVPVLVGATLALFCFWRFIALPKIKGVERQRLSAEQSHLKQCYELHQKLERLYQVKFSYENQLQRQQSLLEQMLQTPEAYSTQIDLYQRVITHTQDYLNLCARAVEQYTAAIQAKTIGIESSRLSALMSSNQDADIEFELEQLEDQLKNTVPPQAF